MSSNRNVLIETLETTFGKLDALTESASDAALDYRSGPDEWSTREILAHLVDDEMFVMRTRLERIVKEETPSLAPHDEQRWYANRNKGRDTLDDLLADFALQRRASLNIFSLLRDSEWQRRAYHPEYGEFSAEEWLGHWVEHDQVHIRQIEQNLSECAGDEGTRG